MSTDHRSDVYIVTGTSGSGKTSMVAPLRQWVPSGWEVWDIDEIVWDLPSHGHPGEPSLRCDPPDWCTPTGKALFNRYKNICLTDAADRERPVVLCGTLLPDEVFPTTRARFRRMHWLGLYACAEVVRERLRRRGWDERLIEVHATSFTWFQRVPEQIPEGMPLIDTSDREAGEVAREIGAWVLQRSQSREGAAM